jgi:preprotein translocase subunit Sss1
MDLMTMKNKTIDKYKDQLSPENKKLYDKISKERLNISLQGYFLGFIISVFIILYNYYYKKSKLSTTSIVFIVLATSFLTNYFYYTLHPKSDWMLDNIKNTDDAKVWLKMYKDMKKYYHTGLVLGIIAIGILGFAFKC